MKLKPVFISCLNFLVLIVTVFLSIGIYAQSPKYTATWFTDSEGLPQNSIKDLIPDKYGYIWLSTENGIVRYDGQGFKLYNQYLDGFSANRMLFFDGNIEKDSITISTAIGETLLINERQIHRIKDTVSGHLKNASLKVQQQKYSGNKIIYVNRHLQLKSNGKTRFLIGHDSIKEFDDNSSVKKEYQFPTVVGDQFFILADSLYVLKNNKELYWVDNGTLKIASLRLKSGKRKDIYINDNVGQAFLFSDKNVYLLKKVSGSIISELIVEDFDLTSFEVYSIYYDSPNKILFIGSNTKGFCIVKEKVFKTIMMDPNNPDQVEYALAAINDSTLVNPSGGLMVNGKFQGKLKFQNNTDKYLLAFDNEDHIWVKENNRLYRYKKEGNYKKFNTWSFDEEITSLNLINNSLWVGTYDIIEGKGGLFRLDLGLPKPFPEKITVPGTNISYLVEEREDQYIIGSNTGIHTLDLGWEFPQLKKVESLGSPEVRSLYKTGNDVWITTYGQGIFLFRNGSVTSFPLDKNGYLATSHCILEDSNGYFWISTNKGLFQVAKNILYTYADNTIDNIYYQYYDKGNGFYTNEFNGGCYPCAVKQSNGQFYFPSLRGLVSFDPNSVQPNLPQYGVFLDEVTLDEKVVYPKGPISIDRKTGRITFYFSSPHYGNPYNNQIMVKLEGRTYHDWTYINKENNISYTSLSPGNYTLTVRKMTGFDSSYVYKAFTFRIEPAFWQTTWFMIGVLLFVMYLIHLGIQIKLRYTRHKNILLERKISERTSQLKLTVGTLRKTKNDLNQQVLGHKKLLESLTHDIKTPLKYLSLAGRHIYENMDEGEESIRRNAKSIYTSAFQLEQYIGNLLEYTKANVNLKEANVQPFNVLEMVNERILVFENILFLRKITVMNEIEKHLSLTLNKQLFSIVVHNLLDNAIKNTYNGSIVLKHEAKKTKSIFTIADTGFGMSSDKLKYYQDVVSNFDAIRGEGQLDKEKGLGIGIIAELLLIMNAQIKIESSPGKGTRIKLCFPI